METDENQPFTVALLPSRLRSLMPAPLARALPWLIAAAILWLLFRRVSLRAALTAAEHAELMIFVPAALIAVTTWFWLESAALAYLFSRFNAPLSWQEARSLRALTYLLTPINWNLGSGAIVLHLRRSKGIGVLEATSSMLFYELVDGLVFGTLALCGAMALPQSATVRTVAWFAGSWIGLLVVILLFFLTPEPPWRWAQKLRAARLLRTHRNATWRDLSILFSLRGCYFAGFILFFWAGTRAFSVSVPLAHLAATVPLILLVGAIPITPAGLGTQQAVMLYFFQSFGSEAQILAFGLAFPVVLSVTRLPISFFYIRDLAALRSSQRAAKEGGDVPRKLESTS